MLPDVHPQVGPTLQDTCKDEPGSEQSGGVVDEQRTTQAGTIAAMLVSGMLSGPAQASVRHVEQTDRRPSPGAAFDQLNPAVMNAMIFLIAMGDMRVRPGQEVTELQLSTAFIRAMKERGEIVRIQAIEAAGECKLAGAIEVIRSFLDTGTEHERSAAAHALAKIAHRKDAGGEKALQVLRKSLRIPNQRIVVCDALAEAPDCETVNKLLADILHDPDLPDASRIEPARAILLRKCGHKLQEEAMRQVVKDVDSRHKSTQTRATRFLQSEVGGHAQGGVRVLIETLKNSENPNTWANAARGLLEVEVDDPLAHAIIDQAKKHPDPYVLPVVYLGLLRSPYYVKRWPFADDIHDPRIRQILRECFPKLKEYDPRLPLDPKVYDKAIMKP